MSKLLLLLWFGVIACPGGGKREPRELAVREKPPAPATSPAPAAPPAPVTPPAPATSPAPAAPPAPATPLPVDDNDPRTDEEIDKASAPPLWVYFSRDDISGYRAVLLFGHREKVSDVRIEYVVPSLLSFGEDRYTNMQDSEEKIFSSTKLQLSVSFMFEDKRYCGSAKIKQGNIVPMGSKAAKERSLKIESTSC